MPAPLPAPPLANAPAGVPSLRTLGTSSVSAAAGDDARLATPSNAQLSPAAGKIPLADGTGKIDSGWIDFSGGGYVATTRTISAGTGLTGGGDLSADRTISMPAVGPGAGTIGGASSLIRSLTLDAQGRVTAATFVADSTFALAARTISAGAGLTGGGDLTANRTISMPNVGPGATTTGGGGTVIESVQTDAQGRIVALTTVAAGGGGGGTVTGTGVAGRLALWSGASALTSDAELTYDSTTNVLTVGGAGVFSGTLTAAQASTTAHAVIAARTISAGAGLTGGGDLTADRSIAMPNVGPGAGTIGGAGQMIQQFTLDAQGRVTAATAVAAGGGGGSLGSSGQKLVDTTSVADNENHASATPKVVAQFSFDPSIYTLTGATRSLKFRAVAANGNTGLTTHVKLRSVTDAEDIATLNFTSTTPALAEATLTIGAGAGQVDDAAKIYEVLIFVDSPGGPSDSIELGSAELQAINTIT